MSIADTLIDHESLEGHKAPVEELAKKNDSTSTAVFNFPDGSRIEVSSVQGAPAEVKAFDPPPRAEQ